MPEDENIPVPKVFQIEDLAHKAHQAVAEVSEGIILPIFERESVLPLTDFQGNVICTGMMHACADMARYMAILVKHGVDITNLADLTVESFDEALSKCFPGGEINPDPKPKKPKKPKSNN